MSNKKETQKSGGLNTAFIDFFNALEHSRYKAKQQSEAPATATTEVPVEATTEANTKKQSSKFKGKNK